MKKILIVVSILIFSSIIGITHIPKLQTDITNISVEDYSMKAVVTRNYGLDSNELSCKKVKKVMLKCKFINNSFIKKVLNVKLHFDDKDDRYPIILGKNLDTDEPSVLNIKPHQNVIYTYTFLVDATNLSNDEIIDIIEDISFYATGECIGLSCQKPYIKYREQLISKSFKCKIN